MDTHGLEVELEAVQWSFGCKLDDVSQELVASAIAWIEQEVEKPGLSRRCDGQVNSNVARSSGVVGALANAIDELSGLIESWREEDDIAEFGFWVPTVLFSGHQVAPDFSEG